MSGIISFGIDFVAGRKRVPKPAAGRTAFRTRTMVGMLLLRVAVAAQQRHCSGARGRDGLCRTGDASIAATVAGTGMRVQSRGR
jgi:hypothetical protein